MKNENQRRSFLKNIALGGIGAAVAPAELIAAPLPEGKTTNLPARKKKSPRQAGKREFNAPYEGEFLNRVAMPVGGIGAGMFCLEGTGAISHMSIRHHPDVFNEPTIFAAVTVKGDKPQAKVLEGPVPDWKLFGRPNGGSAGAGTSYGLPRFDKSIFRTRFPFGIIDLSDDSFPISAELTGWSPFIPTDEDNSSLPVGSMEYKLTNAGSAHVSAVFSYNAKNFLSEKDTDHSISAFPNGFILNQPGTDEKPSLKASFVFFTDDDSTRVDHCWFRGGWWDPLTMVWNAIRKGDIVTNEPVEKHAPGASLYVPVELAPGASKTIRVMAAWFVPESEVKVGKDNSEEKAACAGQEACCKTPADLGITAPLSASATYKPWYSSKFNAAEQVAEFWKSKYAELRKNSMLFAESFYNSTVPPEVTEAIAANLSIIKSPTVLRQYDGRLWAWEGCVDDSGCCHGSCTHVWNYAQAIPHLFPNLERSLRHTEFCENQNQEGHQGFRANLPITPLVHNFHAAADGQLGGIMKVYRDWRISGDNTWLARMYPMVKKSIDYCIKTWDPRSQGILEEPHHNTYDIEFWGPDGMCTSFYLGALAAMIEMGKFLKKNVKTYQDLYSKGKKYIETELFNGEYFIQKIRVDGLNAPNPAKQHSEQPYGANFATHYSPEALRVLQEEGPKYQYGLGCLSDGILGVWMGRVCGLKDFIDPGKVSSHLASIYKYNLKHDLSEHENPQRPGYALGDEGGLLLCTWPKGGRLSLPFVYSDEVWTGIEYHVAAHLMLVGRVEEGLEIVRTCRDRYDGRVRNPFNEIECGHWYARAMSSYSLLQGLTGVRFDAVDGTLYVDSQVNDFTSFLSTATGFGTVTYKNGKPAVNVAYGTINVKKYNVNGKDLKA